MLQTNIVNISKTTTVLLRGQLQNAFRGSQAGNSSIEKSKFGKSQTKTVLTSAVSE